MITYTIPIEFDKFKRKINSNDLLAGALMIGVVGAVFGVILTMTVSFLMIALCIVIGTIIYYKRPQTISQHATDQLNRIVQFEDGTVVPLHQFIIWHKSNRHKIVVQIVYDSPVKVIFENKKIDNPQSDKDIERNADVDTCRDTFGIKSVTEMSEWIDQRLSIFESYYQGRQKRIYEQRRMRNNKHQQHAIENADELPDAQSIYQLNNEIKKDAIDNEQQLNALIDNQKTIVEDAKERQKGRIK